MGSKRLSDHSGATQPAKRSHHRKKDPSNGKVDVNSIAEWATNLASQQQSLQAENTNLTAERDELAEQVEGLEEKVKLQGEELDSAYLEIQERDDQLEEGPKLQKSIDLLVKEVIIFEQKASDAMSKLEKVETERKKLEDEVRAAKVDVQNHKTMAERWKGDVIKLRSQIAGVNIGKAKVEPLGNNAHSGIASQPAGSGIPNIEETDNLPATTRDQRQLALTMKELRTARQHSANTDKRAADLAKDVKRLETSLREAEQRAAAIHSAKRDPSVEICTPPQNDVTQRLDQQIIAHAKAMETIRTQHQKEMRDCEVEEKRLQRKVDEGHTQASQDQKKIAELGRHKIWMLENLERYKRDITKLRRGSKHGPGPSGDPRIGSIATGTLISTTALSSGPAWPESLENLRLGS